MKKLMKEQKKKLIYRAIIIVQLFLLIGVCTYAWFESNFDPIIYSSNLKISASDGLFIQLTDDEEAQSINVKTVVKDLTDEFGLAQVSTVDGVNFFKKKGESTNAVYNVAEKNSDYICHSFMVSGETTISGTSITSPDRYIYIKDLDMYLADKDGNKISDTYFSTDTIRMNLGYQVEISDDVYETHSYLLCCNKEESGVQSLTRYDDFKDDTLATYSSSIIKNMVNDTTDPYEGYELYTAIQSKGSEDPDRYGTQKVKYACQYIYDDADATFDSMECIPNGYGTKITLTIWLEGADPRCELPISGSRLYYKITFGSYYYKISFDANGGNAIKPLIFNTVGSQVGTLPTPTGGSGNFQGWYDSNNNKWENSTIVSDNVTLTARYS